MGKNGKFFLIIILVLSSSCGFVSADMPAPKDMTIVVHIEKDGIPYNESLAFSLNCYRYTYDQIQGTDTLRNKTNNESNPLVLVFTHTHSRDPPPPHGYYDEPLIEPCSLTGSPLSGQYCDKRYSWKSHPEISELCELNGSTETGKFSVWNRTDMPVVKIPAPGSKHFEFYFSLPSDNQTPGKIIRPSVTSDTARSPVESLYCSILSFISIRC